MLSEIMDNIMALMILLVVMNVNFGSSQSVQQTYLSTACFYRSGIESKSMNITLECPASQTIEVKQAQYFRPNAVGDDCSDDECCSMDHYTKGSKICVSPFNISEIQCDHQQSCDIEIKSVEINGCKDRCNASSNTKSCFSRLLKVEHRCVATASTAARASTYTAEQATTAEPTTAWKSMTMMSEISYTTGALLVILGILVILLLGAGLAIAVLLRRLKISKVTEKTAYRLNNSSSIALPSNYNAATGTNNVPSKTTEFKNMACNEDDTEDANYESGYLQIDGNVMANQAPAKDATPGMEENPYYQGEQEEERRESMEENVYYEGSPQDNCDVETVPNQKATEEVRRESMEENVYYEGNPQDSCDVENTTANKTMPPGRQEGNYVYTYGHFQLEGRKRQPDTVL